MNTTTLPALDALSYDPKTRWLHWASACLIVVLWLAGEFLDVFPKGTLRISARSTHIVVGLLLGVLLVIRLRWRRNGGLRLPTLPGGAMGVAAKSGHILLYALIAAMVISGIALVWIRGDNIFNLFTVPAFDPGNKALRHDAKELHGLIANTLLILGGLHGVVALWHQLVLKDGLLRRMWPSPKQAPGA